MDLLGLKQEWAKERCVNTVEGINMGQTFDPSSA